jgi:hypothetical protein
VYYTGESVVAVYCYHTYISMTMCIIQENQSLLFKEYSQIAASTLQKGGGSGLGLMSK